MCVYLYIYFMSTHTRVSQYITHRISVYSSGPSGKITYAVRLFILSVSLCLIIFSATAPRLSYDLLLLNGS